MNITCRSGEVIVMSSARYGRMQPGRCVSRSYGAIGCSTDVLGHLDLVCSGRQSCQLVVPDERLREIRPCPIDFAAYLEISYRCVSGMSLTAPRVKTEFAKRALRVAAPYIWNRLPSTVQTSQSVAVFKSRLKTFLFSSLS